jgi:arylsulfatase A-like enzyme
MEIQTRRTFLRNSLAGALAAELAPCLSHAEGKTMPPNIVFLLTDDQRWDSLGCMGNRIIQTPNLDALAHDGVVFENNFVTTAICCTSRATIFSGRYGGSIDEHRFDKPLPVDAWRSSYPMLLRQAGYRTGFIGKFGIGEPLPSADFDYWAGFPGQGSFYEKELFKGSHLTATMGTQALEFLKGCKPEQPFCLSISFKAPHSNPEFPERPFPPDSRDLKLYSDTLIPMAQTANEESRMRLPEFLRESEGYLRRQAWFKNAQETTRDYYRLITGVDRVVGEIVTELKRRKLLENTVIVFTSDNGYFLGEKGFEGKWLMYEESIRTPLLVYDPRLPQAQRGTRLKPMTLNLDIAPTLLDLAGIKVPQAMKGNSILPLVRGEPCNWRTAWYYEHLFEHPKIPRNEGVRMENFKYIRYLDTKPVYEELYDLRQDPFEENNLASVPEQAERLNELRQLCEKLKKECLEQG